MAKFTEKTIPQEFLLRWKPDGEIQGCHIVQKEQVFKDGKLFTEKTTDPLPVLFGVEELGLELSEVVEGINQQIILNVEQLQSELNDINSEYNKSIKEIEGLRTELTRSETDLNVSKDEVKQLRSEIEEMKTNGTKMVLEMENYVDQLKKTQSELVEAQRVNQELINNISVKE